MTISFFKSRVFLWPLGNNSFVVNLFFAKLGVVQYQFIKLSNNKNVNVSTLFWKSNFGKTLPSIGYTILSHMIFYERLITPSVHLLCFLLFVSVCVISWAKLNKHVSVEGKKIQAPSLDFTSKRSAFYWHDISVWLQCGTWTGMRLMAVLILRCSYALLNKLQKVKWTLLPFRSDFAYKMSPFSASVQTLTEQLRWFFYYFYFKML